MKPIVIASNVRNEIDQCESWFDNMYPLADAGMVIVDTFSTDGTKEFFKEKMKIYQNIVFFQSAIIQTEGYGPARNFLRDLARKHFPEAHWVCYFDADERIKPENRHAFRVIKDYLSDAFDVVAFPRVDQGRLDMSMPRNNLYTNPDWQGRMTRLDSPLKYVRKLHEQIQGCKQIYTNLNTPAIQHFHEDTPESRRTDIAKLCAKLHSEDSEFGGSYPAHPKEAAAFELYQNEGL